MNDEPQHKHRKYWLLCLFAVFIAILGVILPEQEEIAFEIVKNNTDLCNFNHTSLLCNGSRQSNVTYYTNNTPIVLYVFAHASAAGGVAGVFLYRDDILIEAQSGRPLASPEQTWRGITAIIPKNSSYRVNFTNYHHFEWYEDYILSGKNGTLSVIYNNYTNITQSGGVGGVSFDGDPVNLNGSNMFNGTISNYSTLDYTNSSLNLKVNKTGDNITGKLCINTTDRSCIETVFNKTLYINSSLINSPVFAAQMKIDGITHAPGGFAYAMHIGASVAPANITTFATAYGVGFYSAAKCDTYWGDFGNCVSGFLATLTKNGTGNITTAYGLYIQNQTVGQNNYGIYSAGTNPSYFAGDLTLNKLAGIGSNYPVRADSTGKLNVNRTAGAGITMKSPDGNSWCVTVSNAGAMAVAAGACP